MKRSPAGFTLIELLIVVGIIAILAAIAIPNMLEAQIRAKVARTKSDMRTMVTGLESYHVDNNKYPTYHYAANARSAMGLSFHVGGTITGVNASPPFDGRNPLTTPISYLSSPPKDVFSSRAPTDALEADQFFYVNWDYLVEMDPGFAPAPFFQKLQGTWRLHSNGPDLKGPDSDSAGHNAYDPTNGTVSEGDVLRTQRQGQV